MVLHFLSKKLPMIRTIYRCILSRVRCPKKSMKQPRLLLCAETCAKLTYNLLETLSTTLQMLSVLDVIYLFLDSRETRKDVEKGETRRVAFAYRTEKTQSIGSVGHEQFVEIAVANCSLSANIS